MNNDDGARETARAADEPASLFQTALSGIRQSRFTRPVARLSAAAVLSAILMSCGGGGGESTPTVSVRSVSSPVAMQGVSGDALLAFRAALVAAPTYPVQVTYSIAGGTAGAACGAGTDYITPSGSLTIASAAASRQINVTACPGANATNAVLTLSWTDGVASGTATGTILGSANTSLAGTASLNDTGIVGCASDIVTGVACPQAGFAGQDAEIGRDANLDITGEGTNRVSAFIFTKLPAGECYQDSVTGLVWEGKTTSGLHSNASTFTWFSSNATANGGSSGTASGGVCTGVGAGCDTEKFVAAVNAETLCGFTGWRMPTAQELAGIVDSGAAAAPTISASLPNQLAETYWTASPKAGTPAGAWQVDFGSGALGFDNKNLAKPVRLVRGR